MSTRFQYESIVWRFVFVFWVFKRSFEEGTFFTDTDEVKNVCIQYKDQNPILQGYNAEGWG